MYQISKPVDEFGRFQVSHILDQAGDAVAVFTIAIEEDPHGISGMAATLKPYSGYAGPRWVEFVDHLGKTPKHGRYPESLRGDEDKIRQAITS